MKKIFVVALVLLVAVGMSAAVSAKSVTTEFDVNGPHYNLNLLGKKWDMGSHEDQFDNPDRGTIFVPIETDGYWHNITAPNGEVIVQDGIEFLFTQNNYATDFSVFDGNAIDDGSCALELPAGKYRVFIEVKAKNPKVADAFTNITSYVYVENGTADSDPCYYLFPVSDVWTLKKSKTPVDATELFFVDEEENFYFNGDLDLSDWAAANGFEYYEEFGGLWVFEYMDAYFAALSGMDEYDLHDAFYFWDIDNHGNKQIKLRFYPI